MIRPYLFQLFRLPALILLLNACGAKPAEKTLAHVACKPAPPPTSPSRAPVTGRRYLVKWRPTLAPAARLQALAAHAPGTRSRPLGGDWSALEWPQSPDAFTLLRLAGSEAFAAIEPDAVFETQATKFSVDDPDFANQWAHQKVRSEAAWELSTGGDQVVVAIVDGGVEADHPDIEANLWRNPRERANGRDDDGNGLVDDLQGWDFLAEDADPGSDDPAHIHGTHVSGVAGAVGANGKGIVGHAPHLRLMILKYISTEGRGYTSAAIRAIDYAVANGAHIINASWSSETYTQALYDAIARARDAGVLFVTAAGNDDLDLDQHPRYPAAYNLDNIISVGASTPRDKRAGFSNYGATRVDIVAPGVGILSTATQHDYVAISGTSMAAPAVAGVAALIKARYPDFTYRELAGSIFMGAEVVHELRDRVRLGGRLDARGALNFADRLAAGTVVIRPELLCP